MKVLLMAGILSVIFGFFGCDKKTVEQYDVDETYKGLRDQVFSITPASVGLDSDGSQRVWGVLMETGYDKAVVSLLAVADGTVSLYFSSGGGFIGLGEYKEPVNISNISGELLTIANSSLGEFVASSEKSLPLKGMTKFYIFTYDGILVAEAKEDAFANKSHKLMPLFFKAQEMITAIRIIEENKAN